MPTPGQRRVSGYQDKRVVKLSEGGSGAGANAAQANAAATQFAGMPLENFRLGVPQELQGAITDADSVQALLGQAGMKLDQQRKLLSRVDENGNPAGAADALAFLNNPKVLETLKARMAAVQGAGPQMSGPAPSPAALEAKAAQEAEQGGAKPAAKKAAKRSKPAGPALGTQPAAATTPVVQGAVPGPSPAAQAAAAAGEPAPEGLEPEDDGPDEYRQPVAPNVETTQQWIDSVAGRFMSGQVDAKNILRMEHKQSPDGGIQSVYEFSDGSKVLATDGNPTGVVPPPSTGGATPSAPGDQNQQDAQGSQDKKAPKPSRFSLPFDEQLAARREMYEKSRKNPSLFMVPQEAAMRLAAQGVGAVRENLPTIGSLTALGAAGYGAHRLLTGGQQPPPPQNQDDGRGYDRAFRPLPIPQGAGGSAPMQPAPQPAQPPVQQPNPAGTAPRPDTTLLNRIMRSREYA